ncbi:MAG: type I DNA topoisomerase [Chitinispirillaceae bacterium]|nr:type I DNA topoisomerase [Chitinispirillaceae bacterium]
MPKHLVIVESPAKCKTIAKYLGKDYSIKATMGHVIDLPEKELGVDIQKDFAPTYVISRGKRKIVRALRDEAGRSDDVFLAPDPDREGEAIAWHVAQSIQKENANIRRVQFNEITRRAVTAAFESPREIDMNKVNAQQARRILDRIVGYQVSPILWRTVYRGLSAGRVQSVALRLICEREDAIKAFVQREYWSIIGRFEHETTPFSAKLIAIDGKKQSDAEHPLLGDAAAAHAVKERLSGASFAVSGVVRSEKERKPYPPFITSTLQQEAARKLSFSAAKTMMVAQQLYEGLELGDLGSLGLITYMRTDSTRVAQEAIADARNIIASLFGSRFLPASPRLYGKSKNVQDAHEAIRPSQVDVSFAPDAVRGYLSRDQYRLYELIWKRFLASQMENAVLDLTRIDLRGAGCDFRANGSIMKFQGFLALYDESIEDGTENGEGENERMPEARENDPVALRDLQEKQHFTQPPPRYSEASLVRELEDKGIGRPSTYAQIIDTLKRRKYVDVQKRRFSPTDIGYTVKNILVREFPEIFDVNFTAGMENSLDKIEEGEVEWIRVLKDFYEPFSGRLDTVKENIKELRAQNQEVTERICPLCNKEHLVIKWSRNGRFYACQGFPACKYTESLGEREPAPHGEKCDQCGAPMVVLSVNGRKFLGCSRYPECKNTRSLSTGVNCPHAGCNGTIVERRTRKGKVFYGCSNYPKCTFASWDRPVAIACETCKSPILTYKETRRKGAFYRCPSCRTERPIADVQQADAEQSAETNAS